MSDAPTTTYGTILARNYLPKAVTLAQSLTRHHPDLQLAVLLIDVARDEDLPQIPGLITMSTECLGLSEREVLHEAMIYDLVEFATAVKPLFLQRLLRETDQAVYLDPDMYVTGPMEELPVDLANSAGGILITPHFLRPVTADAAISEGHLLTVGVYNLGFCAVDRRAVDFLQWWWGHLADNCLFDLLSGLFVDQKWVDIGSVLFHATAWQHAGYNVSVANLHERPIALESGDYQVVGTGDRLRLFHFHAFDTSAPTELSTRFGGSTAELRVGSEALDTLCVEYASALLANEKLYGDWPSYPYWHDSTGQRISRHLRRAYRLASSEGALPSPFLPEDREAYVQWRRKAWKSVGKGLVGDAAKSARAALPDEILRFKKRFPKLAGGVRENFVSNDGIWG